MSLPCIFLSGLLLTLFEINKTARYSIAGFFIFFWSFVGYGIGAAIEPKSTVSILGIVLAIVFLMVSLRTHKNAFYWMINVDDRT